VLPPHLQLGVRVVGRQEFWSKSDWHVRQPEKEIPKGAYPPGGEAPLTEGYKGGPGACSLLGTIEFAVSDHDDRLYVQHDMAHAGREFAAL
jgi:hypothetical protein